MSDQSAPASRHPSSSVDSAARRGFSQNLRARDLFNVAIFAVIYLVVVFGINMLGFINPFVMLIALLVSAIASGIPFMFFLTRVKRPGMVALFGLVFGLVCVLLGFGWICAVFTVALSVVAEVILRVGRYRSLWAAVWACTVFTLWFVGPWIPLLIDREAYLNSAGMQMNGADYVAAFDDLITVPVVLGYDVATLVCGFLGALLGATLLDKHFVRAGLA